MRRISQFLFLVPPLMMAAGCGNGIDVSAFAQSPERGTFERALTVDGPVDITLRTGSGHVDIRTGTVNRVRVVGHITASHGPCVIIGTRCLFGEDGDAVARIGEIEAVPPIEQAGNVIRIGHTNDDPRYRNISISYELTVPTDTQVTSRTGSGDQTIGSLNGAVRAQTGSGDIQVERAGGGLDARTGGGDIRANAVGGAIMVKTGSGDVDVVQVLKADVEAHTGSGDVVLRLPADAAFDLTARTGSGSIETSQPVQAQGKQRRHRLEGAVRGGGTRVDITTGSGSIRIR